VAGTDLQELTCSCLMPDERREFHKIRPTSHTLLSVNCLYQMNMEKRKGVFTNLRRSSTNMWGQPPSALQLSAARRCLRMDPGLVAKSEQEDPAQTLSETLL
jgi:hypothetical protein